MSSTALARKRAAVISQPLRSLAPFAAGQQRIAPLPLPHKLPRTKVACDSCRSQRAKCPGHRPKCSRCQQLGIECKYSDRGLRKKRPFSRETRMLYQAEIDKYKLILDYIRKCHISLLPHALSFLRTDKPLDDFVLFIRNETALLPEYAMSSLPIPPSISPCAYATTYDRGTPDGSYDPRLAQNWSAVLMDVKPWTDVAVDNYLLSLLILSYIIEENHEFQCFDTELFLAAMNGGDGSLCSVLLVNTILAQGCYYATSLPTEFRPHNLTTLHYLFLQEALQLWQKENGTSSSIVTAQAGLILFRIMTRCGLKPVANLVMDLTFAILRRCISDNLSGLGAHRDSVSLQKFDQITRSIDVTQRIAYITRKIQYLRHQGVVKETCSNQAINPF